MALTLLPVTMRSCRPAPATAVKHHNPSETDQVKDVPRDSYNLSHSAVKRIKPSEALKNESVPYFGCQSELRIARGQPETTNREQES